MQLKINLIYLQGLASIQNVYAKFVAMLEYNEKIQKKYLKGVPPERSSRSFVKILRKTTEQLVLRTHLDCYSGTFVHKYLLRQF